MQLPVAGHPVHRVDDDRSRTIEDHALVDLNATWSSKAKLKSSQLERALTLVSSVRNEHGEVLIGMFNHDKSFNFAESFLQNFACWLRVVRLDNYVLFAMDEEAQSEADRRGIRSVRGDLVLAEWLKRKDIKLEKWSQFLRSKPVLAYIVLEGALHVNGVVWSDLDVVWFRNPFTPLRKLLNGEDAVFSSEGGELANTGVYYVNNTEHSRKGLLSWVEMCLRMLTQDDATHDQELFNGNVLHKTWLNVAVMEQKYVKNGQHIRDDSLSSYAPDDQQLALHCNMMWGVESKVNKLKSLGLYLATDNTDGHPDTIPVGQCIAPNETKPVPVPKPAET